MWRIRRWRRWRRIPSTPRSRNSDEIISAKVTFLSCTHQLNQLGGNRENWFRVMFHYPTWRTIKKHRVCEHLLPWWNLTTWWEVFFIVFIIRSFPFAANYFQYIIEQLGDFLMASRRADTQADVISLIFLCVYPPSNDGWILNAFLIYFDRTTLLLPYDQMNSGKENKSTQQTLRFFFFVVVFISTGECFINSTLFYEQKIMFAVVFFPPFPISVRLGLNAWKKFFFVPTTRKIK